MTAKMSFTEKLLEASAFILLILTFMIKYMVGVQDTGTFVILAFTGILLFVIFLVCAFFPADWRMTEKQKKKIKDLNAYQNKYRKILVGINFIFSILICLLILCTVK